MRPWILCLFVACVAPAAAQTPPDDSAQYHLVTVTADPPTPVCARLQAALEQPALAKIAAGCKVFRFTPNDPIYRARYADALPPNQLPVIALARFDGGVLYKASGGNIPAPDALAVELTRMASLDQQAVRHARHSAVPHPADTYGPLRPDGWNLPSLRPNLIPDTVVIRPEINVPGGGRWVVMGVILIVCLLSGLAVVALVFGLIHIFTK